MPCKNNTYSYCSNKTYIIYLSEVFTVLWFWRLCHVASHQNIFQDKLFFEHIYSICDIATCLVKYQILPTNSVM